MHYSWHRPITASVAYVTALKYASTNDQWAHLGSPLVSVQFSYVALYTLLHISC